MFLLITVAVLKAKIIQIEDEGLIKIGLKIKNNAIVGIARIIVDKNIPSNE